MPNQKQKPVSIKPLKNYWVVITSYGEICYSTISFRKKYSIEKFLTKVPSMTWEKIVKEGYRCIKVNIEFKPVK